MNSETFPYIYVYVGIKSFEDTLNSSTVYYNAAQSFPYDVFDPNNQTFSLFYDIGLILLHDKIVMTHDVHSICLPDNSSINAVDEYAIIVGWGSVNQTDEIEVQLQKGWTIITVPKDRFINTSMIAIERVPYPDGSVGCAVC